MSTYQINDLERLTGVKAHTIRIWEKRYSLIKPHRTASNRRYYDDAQVKKLLNVATLVTQGHKISTIASFSQKELSMRIQENEATDSGENNTHNYVNNMIAAMLVFDEQGFERVFSAAVTRMGMYDAMHSVVYPFLQKAGVMWSIDAVVPAQEHFASCIIRNKLMAATDGLLPPTNKSKKLLLFLPPSEWHDIGLLFANYALRAKGYSTVYLGQNVPMESIDTAITAVKPTHVFFYYITTKPKEEIEKEIDHLVKRNSHIKILYSGAPGNFDGIRSGRKNVSYISGVNELISNL